MAVRGSGIGASLTGGLGTTSVRSGSAQSVYGQSGPAPSKGKTHTYLLALVVLELAALLFLRHSFRHHRGG